MKNINKNNFLFEDITKLEGIGMKLGKYLKNKKIEKVKDLLFDLPYEIIDRSNVTDLSKLEIGKITTIKVFVEKYNFPRIRGLPNKVICSDKINKINIIFFNSREGYIRKVLPLKKEVIISGKINFYKKNYQITNPNYIKEKQNKNEIIKVFPKYALTEGLREKTYRNIITNVLKKLNDKEDWYTDKFLKRHKFNNLQETLLSLHNPKKKIELQSNDYRRLAFDEIFSNLIFLSTSRKVVKVKKKIKNINNADLSNKVLKNFGFELTKGQNDILSEIVNDIKSDRRMFRLLQGDVGSGKTILALLSAAKVIDSNYQIAFMAPTEILSKQHYNLAINLFSNTNIEIELLTGKTKNKDKNDILTNIKNGKIKLLFGTHALFQNKINFKNLGLIIIDEQHKFGVRQRIKLAKKGGKNCDLLLMSATPIPRTMMLSFFGDMDISRLKEKPKNRKKILTLLKPENKVDEIWPLLKKEILLGRQIFWICPLIEDSGKVNFTSVTKKFAQITKIFPDKVGLIHGSLDNSDKKKVLEDFEKGKIKILISTTVIEVGIDYPSASIIIIEDSNKFGLSQLHQLRGRVGRGNTDSICILLYKKNLSTNAKKRLKILRSSNDGFLIAEKDMELRGHGDISGFQQSGIKNFRFADPIQHKDLFLLAERSLKKINSTNIKRFENLLKFFDKADIINELEY
jgi:ATP-dependent DNA helicase RecG